MRPRQILCFSLALLAVTLAAQSVLAQDDPNFEIGLKPFGSYRAGEIDNINLANGSLGADIPLISYPQKGGKLKLDFALHYFNGSSYEYYVCYSVPGFGTECTLVPGGSYSGFEIIDKQAFTFGPPLSFTPYQTCTSSVPYSIFCNLQISDTDGASHLYAPINTTSSSYRSLDASGILGNGTNGGEGAASFVDEQGIVHTGVQYGVLTDTREDPNGNEITYSASAGWTDSMGRTIPAVPSPSSSVPSNCPQPPAVPLTPTGGYVWSPPGSNGEAYTITFCYATATYTYQAGGSAQVSVLQSVILPDGTSWDFTYGQSRSAYIPIMDLAEITFPTGGTISYTWTTTSVCGGSPTGNEAVATRTLNPNDGVTPASEWTYAYNSGGGMTTETDPLGNASVHTFGFGGPGTTSGCQPYENQVKYYQGSTSGTLLKTVNTTYSYTPLSSWYVNYASEPYGDVVPTETDTIWANGQESKVTHSFDSPGFTAYYPYYSTLGDGGLENSEYPQYTGIYGKEVTKNEYDYDGTLLRTTNTGWRALSDSNYLNANLMDLPSSVQITGSGSGSYTTYGYDEGESGIHGNLTSTHRWLNTTGGYLVTTNVYDSYGRVTSTTDPLTHPTLYGYGSCYAGSGPSSVTNALNQTTNYCYDFNTGLLTSTINPNGQTTSYAYDDMLRTTQVTNPDGGGATFSYPNPTEVDISEKITASVNKTETAIVDGLGRLTQTQLTSDPDGTTYTQIVYDGNGRKYEIYNPTRCSAITTNCGESTWGYTTYQYDALGRTTLVTEQDGSTISTDYSAFPCVTGTDEALKKRESCSDGLGRLKSVTEDPGGLGYVTNYTYDALDDLTGVIQSGSRQRTFVYDSLSRLVSSTNPESNWSNADQTYVPTTYAYDGDGNLINKTEPAQNQDGAAQVTLTYCYDQLNRMTAKAYTLQTCSNGTMPSPVATYTYDQASCLGQPHCYDIGHRTGMVDQAGSEAWAYDSMGRAIVDYRTTNGVSKSIPYSYNLDGSNASVDLPLNTGSSWLLAYQPGGAGRTLAMRNNGTSIVEDLRYTPSGTECYQKDSFDGVFYRSETFNSRLQLLTTGSLGTNGNPAPPPPCTVMPSYYPSNLSQPLDLAYNYVDASGHDNGNVQSITNNLWGQSARSQVFTYDSLNRLSSASTTSTYSTSPSNCWGENYSYDPWGNLLSIAPVTGSYTGCTQESGLSVVATAQNQISGDSYDTAGNLIAVPGGGTYTYDAENHLLSAGGVTYTYDGDGKRVMKSNGTIYWYGLNASPMIETDLSNNLKHAYFFVNGERVASDALNNQVNWYFADAIGNVRFVWQCCNYSPDQSDYYPFGGERILQSSTNNHYKFTGKERDSESGLDNFGARYNSSQLGRFMSPDPLGGSLIDPQTLNKYSYVRNNPINLTDPTGLYTCADEADCKSKQDIAFEKARQQDLKSKDSNVVRAANAYGDPTKDNGVGVQFGDPGNGRGGITNSDLRVDPTSPTKFQAVETVTIRPGTSGSALDATVGHEGSHVADAQDFAATINMQGGFDASKNLSSYQTEFRAYMVTQSILSMENTKLGFGDCGMSGPCVLGAGIMPAQAAQTINELLANPANRYGTAPHYGVTPANPGPAIYPSLTTPH